MKLRLVILGTVFVSVLGICSVSVSATPQQVVSKPLAMADVAQQRGMLELDRVVATIDGEPYTSSDLQAFIERQNKGAPEDVNDQQVQKKYLHEMLVEQMLEKEAKSLGMNVTDDDVSRYIEEIKKQNKVDDHGLEALLSSQGMTLAIYRQAVRSDILRTKVVSTAVRSKVNVVEQDVQRYLEEHPEAAPSANSVRVEQILYRVDSGMPDEERKELRSKLNQLRSKLGQGSDWARVGGEQYLDIGFVTNSDLRPELQDAVRDLPVDQPSEVIESAIGYHVLRKKAPTEEKAALDPALKEKIRQQIYEARFKEKLQHFLNEELEKKFQVEVKL